MIGAWKHRTAHVLLILAIAGSAVLIAQRKAGKQVARAPARGPEPIDARTIRDGDGNLVHVTPRQEGRILIADSADRLWTIGVESDGDEQRNSTRQFLTIARFEDVHWTPQLRVTVSGYVYFPAAAADSKGGLWLAWSEFDERVRDWFVQAAYFQNGRLVEPARRVSQNKGPELRPAVVVEADGNPLIVYEAGGNGRFALRAAKRSGGRWTDETLTSNDNNFRPFLTLDRQGRTWLGWDRFTGVDYDVILRSRQNGVWQAEIPFLTGSGDEQRPTLRVDPLNTVWVMAGGRVAGIRGSQRVEFAEPVKQAFDEFLIDRTGRFWFFRATGSANPNTPARVVMEVWDGESWFRRDLEMGLGYRAPLMDAQNGLWLGWSTSLYRLRDPLPPPRKASIKLRNLPAVEEKKAAAAPPPARGTRETVQVDGETYTLYFGEMHTHLTEFPSDRTIDSWADRFYLKAAASGVLDFASASDHDWQWMTASKYFVLQAYAAALNQENQFLAFAGYEWSGDNYRRRRFGDRTIIFPRDYSPVFRITDPESDTPQKLHARLQSIGAIDWAHHVGAPFAVMDWSTHNAVVEPVMEMVSGHGVYETYDRPNAVPVWLTKPPIGKTSIQDGLAMGKRFGLVGSSDSHNGLSGYSNGMLGVYAKSLTRASIMEALRARRTFAVRGGEPLLVDLRLNGSFLGREVTSSGPPRVTVQVRARSPIEKIEIIRDGKYVHTQPGSGVREARFDYQDTEKGAYYYTRVWLEGGKYAWSSPAWTK